MQHIENHLRPWSTLLQDTKELPAVMTVIVKHGGTRPVWCTKGNKKETMLLAWPQSSFLRSSIIVTGKEEGKLDPVSVMPFMEGIANPLCVEKTYAWKNGIDGEVACAMGETGQLLWFYDPLFFRDVKTDLTEGVTQTFYVSGLCLGIRPALLDELTITQGPDYEQYLAAWLQENPDKKRIDAPPLKVPLKGQRILAPTEIASEYQARAIVSEVETINYGPEQAPTKVYRFGVTFGQEQFLHIMMYVSEKVCLKGYEPKAGDEVDMLFWLQGRIVDVDEETEKTASEAKTPLQ